MKKNFRNDKYDNVDYDEIFKKASCYEAVVLGEHYVKQIVNDNTLNFSDDFDPISSALVDFSRKDFDMNGLRRDTLDFHANDDHDRVFRNWMLKNKNPQSIYDVFVSDNDGAEADGKVVDEKTPDKKASDDTDLVDGNDGKQEEVDLDKSI